MDWKVVVMVHLFAGLILSVRGVEEERPIPRSYLRDSQNIQNKE